MAKELIFMGRKDGKVRLALFDSSHGVARRLPVKEVPEDVFVQGIKDEKLPVRGFGVNRGRVTCKYGDWYRLPEVGEGTTFSIFGLTHFGCVETNEEDEIPNQPYSYGELKQSKFYGLATVEWDTGMFRVISPSTYSYMTQNMGTFFYTYDGPITRNKIHPKGELLDQFYDKADYVFSECPTTETLEEIASWSKMPLSSPYIFFQWLFQKCEPFAYKDSEGNTEENKIKRYMLESDANGYPEFLMLGTEPLDIIDLPSGMDGIAVLLGRKVNRVNVNSRYSTTLTGFDNLDVYCGYNTDLYFSLGTHARLIREPDSPNMSVYGWEGYEGSNGDYTGLNISTLSSCFTEMATGVKIIVDAVEIRNCFNGMVNAEVILKKTPNRISGSFSPFIGDVKVDELPYLDYSFNKVVLKSPLDLRKTEFLSNSCNEIKGEILLPDAFYWLERRIFQDAGIDKVKMKFDPTKRYCSRNYAISIDNKDLIVEVENTTDEGEVKFQYGEIRDLYYETPHGSLSPRFSYTSILPTRPVHGVTELVAETFSRVSRTTLDLGLFPSVTTIPKDVAIDCKFSSIIFGPNVKKIEAGAFISCDSVRWVYIPGTVEDIGLFIRRPRIPYTIVTQEGSPADEFAKKYGIEVQYVANQGEFKKVTQEIPEEMEGAVAIAILSGTGDGEEAAVLQACETVSIADDYKTKFTFIEKTSVDMDDVEWLNSVTFGSDKPDYNVTESPRLHAVMATISNNAEYNPNVVKATSKIVDYTSGMFRSGVYAMAYVALKTSHTATDLIWVVLKGTKIINAFTERVSAIKSSISLCSALRKAYEIDKENRPSTMLSNLVEHLNFTDRGVSIRGKSLKDSTSRKVYDALMWTYPLLGVYKGTGNTRYFVGIDMTTLNLISFKLSSGVVVDDGKQKYTNSDIWHIARMSTGGVQDKELESLEGLTRMYSLIGEADAMLRSCIGKDLPKCKEYDFTLPTAEIESLSVISRVLSGYGPSTTTIAELKDAFKTCGLAQPISARAWENVRRRTYCNRQTDYHCSDGKVTHYETNYGYASWFIFSDGAGYTFAINDSMNNRIQSLIGLYSTDFSNNGFHEEHYALVNAMLPASDFLIVRDFKSGGTYSRYGTINVCLAVSRISGKVCVAGRVHDKVIPLFWTNSFANAVRVLELSGLVLFNHNQEWTYKSSDNLTSGIFADENEFNSGKPSFKYASYRVKKTRDYIRRGETDEFACPAGNHEIYALVTKNPVVSDYVPEGEGDN